MAEVEDLAKSDSDAAYRQALEIDDRWRRAQALGWVARYAPQSRVKGIAAKALEGLEGEADYFKRVGGAAWPIRALIEREEIEAAQAVLVENVELWCRIEYPGSLAEAADLILQAALAGPAPLWRPVFDELLRTLRPERHWRERRAVRDAIHMVYAIDAELARSKANSISDRKCREQIERGWDDDFRRTARPFFW